MQEEKKEQFDSELYMLATKNLIMNCRKTAIKYTFYLVKRPTMWTQIILFCL